MASQQLRPNRGLVLLAHLGACLLAAAWMFGREDERYLAPGMAWFLVGIPAVFGLFVPLVGRIRAGQSCLREAAPLFVGMLSGLSTVAAIAIIATPFSPAYGAHVMIAGVILGPALGALLGALVVGLEGVARGLSPGPRVSQPELELPAGRNRVRVGQGLTLLYDPASDRAQRFARWALREPAYVSLAVLPAGSAAANRAFPTLDQDAARYELHLLAEDGRLWRGSAAWLVLAWVFCRTREAAVRLAANGDWSGARTLLEERAWLAGSLLGSPGQ